MIYVGTKIILYIAYLFGRRQGEDCLHHSPNAAAIAPTMLPLNQPAESVHSRGDGLSSPCRCACSFSSVQKSHAHPFFHILLTHCRFPVKITLDSLV